MWIIPLLFLLASAGYLFFVINTNRDDGEFIGALISTMIFLILFALSIPEEKDPEVPTPKEVVVKTYTLDPEILMETIIKIIPNLNNWNSIEIEAIKNVTEQQKMLIDEYQEMLDKYGKTAENTKKLDEIKKLVGEK